MFGRYIQNQGFRYTSKFWIDIWDIPVFVGAEGAEPAPIFEPKTLPISQTQKSRVK